MDEDEISIILKWREEGRSTLEANKLALAELNAALAYRDALRAAGVIGADAETVATATNTAAVAANADAQAEDAAATDENATSQAGLASLLWTGVIPAITASITTLGPWILLIGGATATLFPFVAILAAALIITTSFAVSGTALVALFGGLSLGFLALGAGATILAEKFQLVNNSFGTFKNNLNELGINLAQAAAPSANSILGFLTSLIPIVQSQGEGILSWFGVRLPYALGQMHAVIRDLLPVFDQFGAFLGGIYDKVASQLGPMFEFLARLGVGAAQGLIANLAALADWFQQRLPTYGPVISQIFSGIGNAVQWAAIQFGKLSDWFVANWPSIKGNLDAFTSGFSDGFKALNAIFGGPGSVDWKGFFKTLGEVLGGAAAAIGDLGRAIGIIFSQVTAAMPAAFQVMGQNWNGFVNAMGVAWAQMVNSVIDGLNVLIRAYDLLPGAAKISEISKYGIGTPTGGGAATGAAAVAAARAAAKGVTIIINGVDTNNTRTVARAVSSAVQRQRGFAPS